MAKKAKEKVKDAPREEIDFETELGPKKRDIPSDSEVKRKTKKKKKSRKKGSKKGLIVIIIVAVLVIAAGVGVYFVSQNEDGLFSMLPFAEEYQSMIDLETKLNAKEAELNLRESELITEENRLTVLASQLEQRELQLQQSSTSYNGNYIDFVDGLTEDKIDEIMRVSVIYNNMEAEDAARILAEIYEVNEISIIMFYMKPSQAAAVMTYMDTSLAAQVTRNLVN